MADLADFVAAGILFNQRHGDPDFDGTRSEHGYWLGDVYWVVRACPDHAGEPSGDYQ